MLQVAGQNTPCSWTKIDVIISHKEMLHNFLLSSLDDEAGPAEEMDPYELMDPVDILSKIPKDFYEKIVSACVMGWGIPAWAIYK